MPELPDVTVYLEALERRVLGQELLDIRLGGPFLLRTVDPPVAAFRGRPVRSLARLGKRIVMGFDEELFLVLHLMIAGRLHWREPGAGLARKVGLAAFDFPAGSLVLTEQGSKKRASLHLLRGAAAVAAQDRGGLEPLAAGRAEFAAALTRENHTVKRALTDPRLFSGIGNAYADEILHAARLSPVKMTRSLSEAEIDRLHAATRDTLQLWIERLRAETGEGFPEKVTAFRPAMAAHGRYGKPCPVCGAPIQRIVHAANETNYCAGCQTGGRLLADRALSRLLKADWPRTLEELEDRQAGRGRG
ncbi:MAG: DNA-formamidopyrimidine glycosylase family protein [Dongiaceae bacterium]